MENSFTQLSNTPIFKGLKPEQLEKLFSGKLYRVKSIKKDEYAAFANDRCENLMLVIKGSVRGEMTDHSGKVIKIEDIDAPRPIAPAFIFGHNNHYPVDIIGNEPTTLFILPKETLIQLLQENRIVLNHFLNAISNRAQFLSDKIRFLSFKTIKGKIASYLVQMADKETMKLMMPGTQTQLADYFGVERPSLARVLGEMEKEGILELNNKEIIIKDKKRLTAMIH
jgi:CRP-like cAMP-binding protein